MAVTCNWDGCDYPGIWHEEIRNAETGETKHVNLCLIHRRRVHEEDRQLFRERHDLAEVAVPGGDE